MPVRSKAPERSEAVTEEEKIEKLKKRLSDDKHEREGLRERIAELDAKVRELTEALQEIADNAAHSSDGEDLWDKGRIEGTNWAADKALEALGLPALSPRCPTCNAYCREEDLDDSGQLDDDGNPIVCCEECR